MDEWLGPKALAFYRAARPGVSKSICAEAVEQKYIRKDPARRLKTPIRTKESDTTTVLGGMIYERSSAR